MESGIGLGDLLAVVNSRDNNNTWGGSWIWVIFLFFIFMFMGNGLFGRTPASTAFTSTEFTLSNINKEVQDTHQAVTNSAYGLNNSISQVRYDMADSFNGLEHQMAQCCCETNRNIDAVRYENAKNTCDIIAAGQANTQRIIDAMTQDKIEALRTELQSARLVLSNNQQTANLIAALRPFPQPAYITDSPYAPSGASYSCGC